MALACSLWYLMVSVLGLVLACSSFDSLAFHVVLVLLYLMVSASVPGLVLVVPVGIVLVLVCSSFDSSFVLLLARSLLYSMASLDLMASAPGLCTWGHWRWCCCWPVRHCACWLCTWYGMLLCCCCCCAHGSH